MKLHLPTKVLAAVLACMVGSIGWATDGPNGSSQTTTASTTLNGVTYSGYIFKWDASSITAESTDFHSASYKYTTDGTNWTDIGGAGTIAIAPNTSTAEMWKHFCHTQANSSLGQTVYLTGASGAQNYSLFTKFDPFNLGGLITEAKNDGASYSIGRMGNSNGDTIVMLQGNATCGVNMSIGANTTINGGLGYEVKTGGTWTITEGKELTFATAHNANKFKIDSGATVTVTGGGTVNINNDAELGGSLVVNNGTLDLHNKTATIDSSAKLEIGPSGSLSNAAVTLNGNGSQQDRSDYATLLINNTSGTTVSGALTLGENGGRIFLEAGTTDLTLAGGLAGSGKLTIQGKPATNAKINITGSSSGFTGVLENYWNSEHMSVCIGSTNGLHLGGIKDEDGGHTSFGLVTGSNAATLTLDVAEEKEYTTSSTFNTGYSIVKNGAGSQTLSKSADLAAVTVNAGTLSLGKGTVTNATVAGGKLTMAADSTITTLWANGGTVSNTSNLSVTTLNTATGTTTVLDNTTLKGSVNLDLKGGGNNLRYGKLELKNNSSLTIGKLWMKADDRAALAVDKTSTVTRDSVSFTARATGTNGVLSTTEDLDINPDQSTDVDGLLNGKLVFTNAKVTYNGTGEATMAGKLTNSDLVVSSGALTLSNAGSTIQDAEVAVDAQLTAAQDLTLASATVNGELTHVAGKSVTISGTGTIGDAGSLHSSDGNVAIVSASATSAVALAGEGDGETSASGATTVSNITISDSGIAGNGDGASIKNAVVSLTGDATSTYALSGVTLQDTTVNGDNATLELSDVVVGAGSSVSNASLTGTNTVVLTETAVEGKLAVDENRGVTIAYDGLSGVSFVANAVLNVELTHDFILALQRAVLPDYANKLTIDFGTDSNLANVGAYTVTVEGGYPALAETSSIVAGADNHSVVITFKDFDAIPEPTTGALAMLALAGLAARRRRK